MTLKPDDNDSDDYDVTGSNFAKTIFLQEGETVYIAVGYYSLEDPISNTVYVVKYML